MLQIATKTFNNEFLTLMKKKKNLSFYLLSETDLKTEIEKSKSLVTEKLNVTLTESNDSELKREDSEDFE